VRCLKEWPVKAVPAAVLLAVPLVWGNNYILGVMVTVAIFAVAAAGLSVLMNLAGQVSFGHAAFMGLGGYAAAVLAVNYGWPPLLALAAAPLLPALAAGLVGRPVLKLREFYLVLATLAFGTLVHLLFNECRAVTGGPSGLSGIPALKVFGFVLSSEREFYCLTWGVALAVLAACRNLRRSPVGRALSAVHESEEAADACGIDTASLKLKTFVFSAALAGLAGGLYAFYISFVSPSPFGFHASVQLVLMAVLGGSAAWGPVAGAAAVIFLSEFLRWAAPLVLPGAGAECQIVVYGTALVIITIWKNSGVWGRVLCRLPAGKGGKEYAAGSARPL